MKGIIRNHRAAQGITYALASLFLCLVIYAALYPTIETEINNLLNHTDPETGEPISNDILGAAISFIPIAVLIGIILVLIYYIIPIR